MREYVPADALYLLPCDHRSILLDLHRAAHPGDEAATAAWVRDAKQVVVDGLLRALDGGLPARQAGLLMDDEYGADAARRAQAAGVPLFLPVDIGELGPWALQYGSRFVDHIAAMRPAAVTSLVEYNPAWPNAGDQLAALQPLHDWLAASGHPYLLELQVTPTAEQLAALGGDREAWIRSERAALIVRSIRELKAAGARPTVWKIEACHSRAEYAAVAAEARAGGEDDAVLVVLGAGASIEEIDGWLEGAAAEPACIGFAVGRTVWAGAIRAWLHGELSRDEAAARIAEVYGHFAETFAGARRRSSAAATPR